MFNLFYYNSVSRKLNPDEGFLVQILIKYWVCQYWTGFICRLYGWGSVGFKTTYYWVKERRWSWLKDTNINCSWSPLSKSWTLHVQPSSDLWPTMSVRYKNVTLPKLEFILFQTALVRTHRCHQSEYWFMWKSSSGLIVFDLNECLKEIPQNNYWFHKW